MKDYPSFSEELQAFNWRETLREIRDAVADCHSYVSCSGESPDGMFVLIDQRLGSLMKEVEDAERVNSPPP